MDRRKKLTKEQVIKIRNLRSKERLTLKELAERFNIAPSTAGHIARGDACAGWKQTEGPLYKHRYVWVNLTEKDITLIKDSIKKGKTVRGLSRELNIHRAAIQAIAHDM